MKRRRRSVPHPTVPISIKLDVGRAERLYELVNLNFDGNVSAALREAIDDLLEKHEKRR